MATGDKRHISKVSNLQDGIQIAFDTTLYSVLYIDSAVTSLQLFFEASLEAITKPVQNRGAWKRA